MIVTDTSDYNIGILQEFIEILTKGRNSCNDVFSCHISYLSFNILGVNGVFVFE